ncbi:polysaccharide deacetylase family protein [Thalassotalea sp. M1531]|uniref:Polysaccharide deacetylase family protein n=1 Tax=Thalassotalea algicola TaxID=2716224 RepID=A0A7Y0LEF5_9GAMM|nr:polysaccharide deacetylase family protein [Thalassotalea algicola]NMP33028.1 polysaccharide deacetylase family protein [Thalassotalea algicola]
MKVFKLTLLFCFALFLASPQVLAAVILQYHHISTETPPSTSISPEQFERHMQYLKQQGFHVVPLSDIVDAISNHQPLADKTVAITFDDAYIDILTQGKPILDKYDYPYTIFVNPGIIEAQRQNYLSWQQLKVMADEGAIIANHGYNHDSLTRPKQGLSEDMWLAQYEHDLMRAEKLLKENVGQSYRYFAYPYGEYTPAIQQWLKQNQFTGFSQQSGAVGISTDTSAIPRFPASQPYDKIASLRDKLNALPFSISTDEDNAKTIFTYQAKKSVTFNVEVQDFNKRQLNCYISGLGKQKIQWLNDTAFKIDFNGDLPVGRVRCNCTAPSIEKPGRFYWYSKPWFVLNSDSSWYPL